ncbi:recombinase family protein [Natronorubrum sulfidifaciens]|uniref:Resolvase domain-containing protein n=1 Tax=Natronorubrum sulfidifaciens JCM 14089 TaxID=1230460 RepID=L9WEB9_9EURY|nr:recombinase family protein [Natronorubrum sulfidifaciens]ELY46653.1 Resolvase domain-containing protein [Natronorubrum sulfidifaciens JCM 14089]
MRETSETSENVAAYIRASTDKQNSGHQRDDINDWADQNNIDPTGINWYVDLSQSGSDPGREQFIELTDDIDAGEYDRIIVWEISRLARLGSIYQEFFETASDAGTIINITNDWTDTVKPDGTGKLIADISAAVAEEERRKLISRVNSGVKRAKKEGKWLGEVPVGFERNAEGYLRPTLTPDEGDDGYLEIRAALEAIENGSSYRQEAKGLNTTRQTLSRIHQDEDRRQWYLDATAKTDDRIAEALDTIPE